MIVKPALDSSLIRIFSGWIRIDLLFLLLARENQILDQAQAPVGEVVVVLVGVRSCDSPILDGTIFAGLKNMVWKLSLSEG